MESNRFSSIKWKFILVYFLLVFIAMAIVGVFIVGKLETQQVENVNSNMEKKIETIMNTSTYLMSDNWEELAEEIQLTLEDWRLDSKETIYIISVGDIPKIIASSEKNTRILDRDALPYENIDTMLLKTSIEDGKKGKTVTDYPEENTKITHLSYPVFTEVGKVKGIIYMTSDLKDALNTMKDSKIILTNATLIALGITVTLGFLIANSIVEPIRDVTKKAEEMAMGDFDQKVEVKSNDEIGQLANMFNYLTLELKNRIEEIDLERSKLDAIFNYMSEGLVAIDKRGFIIHANPVALEVLEMKNNKNFLSDDIKVKFPFKKINFEELDYENTEEKLTGDQILELQGEIYKIKYAPFKNEKEEIGGIILVFQNMTNEHRLDDLRKDFVANVSHELKTPITTIKSYTETLMDGGVPEEMELNFLHVIDDECNRMNRLVRDLLQLSNLDFKKTVWKKEEVLVDKFLRAIVEKLEFSFKEKNQQYRLYIDPTIKKINIDRDAIEQVVLNIISNAIKYTGENGQIQIYTEGSENFLTIGIRDNGIGIPKEDLDRIFERFYRVEKGRSRDSGGTGLGLAIAKEIIEGHNGIIEIDSQFQQGTEVKIKLPIDRL